jgi:L-alanine-DL-glutamate epimerase-like enolase superfamily enzyme
MAPPLNSQLEMTALDTFPLQEPVSKRTYTIPGALPDRPYVFVKLETNVGLDPMPVEHH